MPEDITKDSVKRELALGDLNPKMFRKFFADMQIKSYQYDYRIQKDLVNYHEERFTTAQLKVETAANMFENNHTERVMMFPMKHQFIATGRRKAWRDSAIYNKALTFDDVNHNRRLFKYNVLVFIDNKLFTNIRIKPNEEFTNIYFRRRDIAKYLIDTAKVITVLFIPNAVISVAENIDNSVANGSALSLQAFNSTASDFNITDNYFALMQNKATQECTYARAEYDADTKRFVFPGHNTRALAGSHRLIIIGTELLFKIIAVEPNTEWVDFELKSMPLPKHNIIVMQHDKELNTFYPNTGSIVLSEAYPNIIGISNPQKFNLLLIALYADHTQNKHIKFDTEMDYYLEQVDLLQRYNQNTVPDILRNYVPAKWDYSLKEYFDKNNGIHEVDMTERWNPFHYKMNTISGLIKLWAEFYLEYERRTYGFLTGWYHDISKWSAEHLASKERTSTDTDVPWSPNAKEQVDHKTFAETQYVFTYKNDMKYDDANSYLFYIDGKMVIPSAVIVHRGFQYVYLPKRLIKPDSMIEVERFDGISFSKQFDNIPEEGIVVDLKNILRTGTVANSFFLTDKQGNYANNNFVVSVIDTEMDNVESVLDLTNSVYYITPKMKLRIKPLFPQYANTTVFLRVNNRLVTYTRKNSGDDYNRPSKVNFNNLKRITSVKKDVLPRLRIYTEDGRMFSKRSYVIYKHNTFNEQPKFNLPVRPGETHFNRIAYVGYDERLIYHRRHVRNDGFVDLEGKTTRPICLAYHDIYLNGVRLHKNDIRIIAPFKFIITTLKKHNTLDNLEIYEKVHTSDAMFKFEIDEDSSYLADRLFNQDKEYQKKVLDALEKVNPDGSVTDLNDIRNWYKDFLDDWFFNHFVNADRRYDLEFYEPLFDETHGYRVLLNGDDRVRYHVAQENRFYLWHDKTLGKNNGENPAPRNPYDEVDGNTPDDGVTITEREYLDNGISFGNVKTVYDYDTEILHKPKEEEPIITDLTGKEIVDINQNNHTIIHDKYETGEGFKRDKIGTETRKGTVKEVDPQGPLAEPPVDVVIVPFEDPNPRMPERIATPEPTLPEEGEYPRVEPVRDSRIEFASTRTSTDFLETPGNDFLVRVEDEFEGSISTIGEGGVADGKTSNVLRLVATVKTLARPIFVKVVDAKNRMVYNHKISTEKLNQINQKLRIIPGKMVVSLVDNDPSKPPVQFPLEITFGEGVPRSGILSSSVWTTEDLVGKPYADDTFPLYPLNRNSTTVRITEPTLCNKEGKILSITQKGTGKRLVYEYCRPSRGKRYIEFTLRKPDTAVTIEYVDTNSPATMDIELISNRYANTIAQSIYSTFKDTTNEYSVLPAVFDVAKSDSVLLSTSNYRLRVPAKTGYAVQIDSPTNTPIKYAWFTSKNGVANRLLAEHAPKVITPVASGRVYTYTIPVDWPLTELAPNTSVPKLALWDASRLLNITYSDEQRQSGGMIVRDGEWDDRGPYASRMYPTYADGTDSDTFVYSKPGICTGPATKLFTVREGSARGITVAARFLDPNKVFDNIPIKIANPYSDIWMNYEDVGTVYTLNVGRSEVTLNDLYVFNSNIGNDLEGQRVDSLDMTRTDNRYVHFSDQSILAFDIPTKNIGGTTNLTLIEVVFIDPTNNKVVYTYRYDNRATAQRNKGSNHIRLEPRFDNCRVEFRRYVPPKTLEIQYGAGVPTDGLLVSSGWNKAPYAADTFPMYGEGEKSPTRAITIESDTLLNRGTSFNMSEGKKSVLEVRDLRTDDVLVRVPVGQSGRPNGITFTMENPSYGVRIDYVDKPVYRIYIPNSFNMYTSVISMHDGKVFDTINAGTGSSVLHYILDANSQVECRTAVKNQTLQIDSGLVTDIDVVNYHKTSSIPKLLAEIHNAFGSHERYFYGTRTTANVNSITIPHTDMAQILSHAIKNREKGAFDITTAAITLTTQHVYLDLTAENYDITNGKTLVYDTTVSGRPYKPNQIEIYEGLNLIKNSFGNNDHSILKAPYSSELTLYNRELFGSTARKVYGIYDVSRNELMGYIIADTNNDFRPLYFSPRFKQTRYLLKEVPGSKIFALNLINQKSFADLGVSRIATTYLTKRFSATNPSPNPDSDPIYQSISYWAFVNNKSTDNVPIRYSNTKQETIQIGFDGTKIAGKTAIVIGGDGTIVYSQDLGKLSHPYNIFIKVKPEWNGYSLKIVDTNTLIDVYTNDTLPLSTISLFDHTNNKVNGTWLVDPTHAVVTPIPSLFNNRANQNTINRFNVHCDKLATLDPFDKVAIVEQISGNTTKIVGVRFLSLNKAENSEFDIPFIMKYNSGDSYRIRIETGSTLFGKAIRITPSNNFKSEVTRFDTYRNNYSDGAINSRGLRTLMTNGVSIDRFANDGVIPIIFHTKTQANGKPSNMSESMDTVPWYIGLKWFVGLQIPNSQVFTYSCTTITGSNSKSTSVEGGWRELNLSFVDDVDRITANSNNITVGINREVVPIRYTITYSGINTVKLIDQAGTVKELGTPDANNRSSKTDGGTIGSMPTITLKVLLKQTRMRHWAPDQVVGLYNGDTLVWTLPYDPNTGVDYKNQMENGRNNSEKWLTIEVPIKPDYSFAITTWNNKWAFH